MQSRISAGLLVYRRLQDGLDVFLAHPGGPLFAHKDDGHWTIPKGEVERGEDLLVTAIREFHEETGIVIDPALDFLPLESIQQKGGKIVHAWAVKRNWMDDPLIQSNEFEMEWPPGSGRRQRFPEVDRAQFFPLSEAKRKLKERQEPLLDELAAALGATPD